MKSEVQAGEVQAGEVYCLSDMKTPGLGTRFEALVRCPYYPATLVISKVLRGGLYWSILLESLMMFVLCTHV